MQMQNQKKPEPSGIAPCITRTSCHDLDPQWPRDGRPRGPTLCVLYPDCRCGKEDARWARRAKA